MGTIEAAGDLASGALFARTVEPHAGEGGHGSAAGAMCLNCGHRLIGEHCHACGQSAHVHRTIGSIGHDLLHGVFHFEGKIWRTLPMLVFHPGKLTRRYIAGERARFVSPLALFLFTVFLMFAVYSAVGPGDLTDMFANGVAKAEAETEKARRESFPQRIAKLERERAAQVSAKQSTVHIDRRLAETREEQGRLEAVARLGTTDNKVRTGWEWFDHGVAKVRKNPHLVAYKVQSSAYKYSWALILMSTPLIALLFLWRRGYGMYDHAIFATYSISFMSLLVIVSELLLSINAPGALLGWLVTLAPPVHMFAQLRGAYRLSKFSAAWRLVLLLFFAGFVLLMFVLGLVAMGMSH